MSAIAPLNPALPDARGRFGTYGGRYVPEVLIPALDELAEAWTALRDDPGFRTELNGLLRHFVGRPTPITHARRLSDELGYEIWLKREDLAHTGAHKINNALGQALLAKRLGKERIIAETGAGQHGVAAATACALLGLPCVVYMGEEDTHRQAPNVERMKLLGADVVPVMAGTKTLKEAVNEALRDWAATVTTTHYIIGSVVGPHPFPELVRDLQRVIGDEARRQFAEARSADPRFVVACVGGGSNAIGMFTAFVGAQQLHPLDVRGLAMGVLLPHVDDARHAEQGARCGRGNAVLPGPGFGDDPLLAKALRQQRLSKRVVDLVGAGVRQILALQPDLVPQLLGEAACMRDGGRASDEVPEEIAELRPETGIVAEL
jgi:tryptophan synthase beta subunit